MPRNVPVAAQHGPLRRQQSAPKHDGGARSLRNLRGAETWHSASRADLSQLAGSVAIPSGMFHALAARAAREGGGAIRDSLDHLSALHARSKALEASRERRRRRGLSVVGRTAGRSSPDDVSSAEDDDDDDDDDDDAAGAMDAMFPLDL